MIVIGWQCKIILHCQCKVNLHLNASPYTLSNEKCYGFNQVAWAQVARSSFQGRTRKIPGSIPMGNNA
jgi:hypothetical protein